MFASQRKRKKMKRQRREKDKRTWRKAKASRIPWAFCSKEEHGEAQVTGLQVTPTPCSFSVSIASGKQLSGPSFLFREFVQRESPGPVLPGGGLAVTPHSTPFLGVRPSVLPSPSAWLWMSIRARGCFFDPQLAWMFALFLLLAFEKASFQGWNPVEEIWFLKSHFDLFTSREFFSCSAPAWWPQTCSSGL